MVTNFEAYCTEFPKLKHGGGFELCRCLPNSRQLDVLTAITHSSPSILKDRVGNSRTYLRPLQQDLDMDSIHELPTNGVTIVIVHVYISVL